MKKNICPICGNGELREQRVEKQFVYKGRQKKISNYVTQKCDSCNEEIVSKESLSRAGKELTEFKREIDGLLTPKQIKEIREELELTQERMAQYLGGGAKGFARYESGSICQSRAMDNLLRILQKFPGMIQILHRDEYVVSYEMKGTFSYESNVHKPSYVTTGYFDSDDTREVANGC
jgi:HTH-type transcriptional regulator/antitoxin MqsA